MQRGLFGGAFALRLAGPRIARGAGAMRDSKSLPLLVLCAVCAVVAAGCGAASTLEPDSSSGSGSGGSVGSGGSSTSSSGPMPFPVGTFSNCGVGIEGPDTNVFLNSASVLPDAVLTVTQAGSARTVTYMNQSGVNDTFTFDPTTDTSAVLAPGGAVAHGHFGLCVQGPGDTGSFPATVTAQSGALTYQASTMFLSLEGTIAGGNSTPCGAEPAPARVWFICGAGNDGTASSGSGASSLAPQFPVGAYACTSVLGAYIATGGLTYDAVSGAHGTLMVTQSGATVTAAYAGDMSISGTVDFTATTSTSANAVPGQTLLAPCTVPFSQQGPPQPGTPETLSVAAGSLAVNDGVLFLSFSGTMVSSCPGAEAKGSIVCTKQ